MAKPEVKDVRKELEKYGTFKPYINYYKANPKYRKMLPTEVKAFIYFRRLLKTMKI
jgi:hypothetical protein